MSTAVVVAGVLAVLSMLLLITVVILYNVLVRSRNQVHNAWGQIEVQLTRRHDLIPNLVESVKGYAAHERGALEAVTRARAQAVAASGPQEQAEAEQALGTAIKGLFAVAEAHPQLKANENFLALQTELATTESRVAYARQYYNDAVATYNTSVQIFPNVLVAPLLGFRPQPFFETEGDEQQAVQVRFT